jgi:hypothetical protein
MKLRLTILTLFVCLSMTASALAGECFWRWIGVGHGPGYHAYNGSPAPIPQTPTPDSSPVFLPAATPPAPVNSAWPGAAGPVGWSRSVAPAAIQPWTGP